MSPHVKRVLLTTVHTATDDWRPMERPQPPPEAALIRLVREAAGLKIPPAAKAAGISAARWSQVELGYETRQGQVKPVRATAATLAHMAHAAGLSPDRLEAEGGRPDAAAVLREILRGEPTPPPPTPAPRYSDPALQHVWETPGLSDEVKRGLIALVLGIRAQAEAEAEQRHA